MSFFDDMMAEDAAFAVAGSDSPGSERLVYLKPDGTRRTIYGQVFREGSKELAGASGVSPLVEIYVANSVTVGIAASELQTTDRVLIDLKGNGAMVSLAVLRPGGDGKWNVDAGMIRLALR